MVKKVADAKSKKLIEKKEDGCDLIKKDMALLIKNAGSSGPEDTTFHKEIIN